MLSVLVDLEASVSYARFASNYLYLASKSSVVANYHYYIAGLTHAYKHTEIIIIFHYTSFPTCLSLQCVFFPVTIQQGS